MSGLTVSLLMIIVGLLALITRLFFFVDIKEVEKSNLKKIKMNSFTYITISTLFLSEGIITLFIFSNKYVNPIGIIIN